MLTTGLISLINKKLYYKNPHETPEGSRAELSCQVGLHGSAQDRESISERSSSNLNLEIIRDEISWERADILAKH